MKLYHWNVDVIVGGEVIRTVKVTTGTNDKSKAKAKAIYQCPAISSCGPVSYVPEGLSNVSDCIVIE